MNNLLEYKTGGVFASPANAGADNVITIPLLEIDNGVFTGRPYSGSSSDPWDKVMIFAEIFLLARGSTTGTGAYIRRATFTAGTNVGVGDTSNNSQLGLHRQEDTNVFSAQSNVGPLTSTGFATHDSGDHPSSGDFGSPIGTYSNLSLSDNANTVPRIAWPFTYCEFSAANIGPAPFDQNIIITFRFENQVISDCLWELKLKGFRSNSGA